MLDYQTWLQTQHLASSTIAFYLAQLRTIYNQAIQEGLLPQRDIFDLVGTQAAPRRIHQPLPSIAELRYLRDLTLPALQSFARDLFFFSLYARGISFVDMSLLKKTDIHNGRLCYQPHTSDNVPSVTLPWDDAMQEIADRHPSATDFILPIITHPDHEDLESQIRTCRQTVTRTLRTIGKRYHFSVPPTMSMTRDLYRKVIDEISISKVI